MLIEDVVCPVEHLADMTQDLIQLFTDCGYKDFSAVGHALEGNLHLVFAQVKLECAESPLSLNKLDIHSAYMQFASQRDEAGGYCLLR